MIAELDATNLKTSPLRPELVVAAVNFVRSVVNDSVDNFVAFDTDTLHLIMATFSEAVEVSIDAIRARL